ncbi:MAG TPA: D-lyxose/D-mannose family sugar isomerase [Oceanipulchritudo sp.]|nr:D-lyxose/D-mannose family sugar isomerase [Oceanipulchritudo sp.]
MLKRSVINKTLEEAKAAFSEHHWNLPPRPRWDITDFGLGTFRDFGLTLINLAEEPEYCEKLMFAYENQRTPAHTHARKKEDIICRNGSLSLRLWPVRPGDAGARERFEVPVNGEAVSLEGGGILTLEAGSRITLVPGIYHEFWPVGGDCIIGEVSTANDDANDNFFVDERIGRFPGIEEDAPVEVKLIGEA